jgi:hypothetical protein
VPWEWVISRQENSPGEKKIGAKTDWIVAI